MPVKDLSPPIYMMNYLTAKIAQLIIINKGPFTNYVYKRRGGRWSKKSTFCKLLYHRKCKRRGVGGQKKPNLVNVVCERPPTEIRPSESFFQ